MTYILSVKIIDIISTICPITGNGIIDTVLFAIIAGISFKVAWSLTGAFAGSTGYHDSHAMSLLHRIIRILVFIGLLSVVLGIVHFIRWLLSWPWWGYLIFGVSILLIAGGIIAIGFIKKKKKRNGTNKKK